MTTPLLDPRTLTVADRCGAQAFVRAVLVQGELLFCGHHARAYREALAALAVAVQDRTGSINVRPSPSANSD